MQNFNIFFDLFILSTHNHLFQLIKTSLSLFLNLLALEIYIKYNFYFIISKINSIVKIF